MAPHNQVILLKKSLNQAKIQIIHKLTRKAKMLTEKKAPEKFKGKFNKKAESAVKEVLILKKIKPRDIAKFIVTHKGQLNEYINRPAVDLDKACARLLLHKALQVKYKMIRERFSNISIEDLLMSRQERRKLKKEAREQLKNKKNKKDNGQVQEGDWDVEDIDMDHIKVRNESDDDSESSKEEHDQLDRKSIDSDDDDNENRDLSADNNSSTKEVSDDINLKSNVLRNRSESVIDDSDAESTQSNNEVDSGNDDESSKSNDEHIDNSIGAFVKISPRMQDNNTESHKNQISKVAETNENVSKKVQKDKQKDSNKNKNLKNKILMKQFNKEIFEMPIKENKVADPFFITATGENYMSVAEPRQPDEVKDEHKEGNRKYRRAVMFGHVPKAKMRRDNNRPDRDNTRFSKLDEGSSNFTEYNRFNGFEKSGNQKAYNKSDNSNNGGKFKDRNNSSKRYVEDEIKPEKLHPSWEAKKRQSGILPFQGKKIVFDED